MQGELQKALQDVRHTLLSNPVSPRVNTPDDINRHYCHYVAQTVTNRLDDDIDVKILQDGGRGYVHTWIYHDGSHYDAECVEGVTDYRNLPFFQRHPEAANNVETDAAKRATIRQRGSQPLYPEAITFDSRSDPCRISWTMYWRYTLVSLLLGVLLIVAGLSGEWAIHRHLIRQSARLQTLFIDLEIIGELLLLVSPIIFFVLLPYHRAESV